MSRLGDAAVEYARRGWAVLPLARKNKVPAIKGGCKSATDDPIQVKAWWSSNPEHNVGIATGTPSLGLVVIDIDVDSDTGEDGMATLYAWEREHGELPETITAVTGRGGLHYFYRCNQPIGCSVNKELGVDVRGDGGFVVAPPSLHPNGRTYEWENHPDDYALADADENVYGFIQHVQGDRTKAKRFQLPRDIGEGERNDTLFKYASSLQGQGYDDNYISMALANANRERCHPPLPDADIATIVESVTRRYDKGEPRAVKRDAARKHYRKLDRNGNPTGPVLHHVVAQELIETHKACFVDGAPAIWSGGRYATGWTEIDRATVGLVDDCKIADQREIRHYVFLRAPRVAASPPTLMSFSNGVLDLDRGLVQYDPSMVITNDIPHPYLEDAYDEVADRFLDSVSCGDAAVRANLEEVIGMCMYRSNDFGQCPVLIGAGSNGKSTFIKALRHVLGDENVSSLDINIVGRQFQAGRLLGKLANLGDDISNERLNGDVLSVFKKVVTGEWIYSDVKNGDGFEFKPYCTLVFSCNELPSLGDSSEGVMRRLFPIPFDGHFVPGGEGYDPRLWEKLSSPEASAYLVRVGVEGLRRLRAANKMTANGRSEQMVRDVRADNDSVLQYIQDNVLCSQDFEEEIIEGCFERYKSWCNDSGLHPFSRKKFTQKVNALYGFKSTPAKRLFSTGTRQVRVFRAREVTEQAADTQGGTRSVSAPEQG